MRKTKHICIIIGSILVISLWASYFLITKSSGMIFAKKEMANILNISENDIDFKMFKAWGLKYSSPSPDITMHFTLCSKLSPQICYTMILEKTDDK